MMADVERGRAMLLRWLHEGIIKVGIEPEGPFATCDLRPASDDRSDRCGHPKTKNPWRQDAELQRSRSQLATRERELADAESDCAKPSRRR
ncbi:MAG: hypothetical protein H6Q90_2856 [Deltaproteobacteria bacterium]|nr:hypothetical protein [Deltaproteobacteria bacterium]